MLQIVCGYHALSIPPRGSEFIFHPLEHLQAIGYRRASVAGLGFHGNHLKFLEPAQVVLESGTVFSSVNYSSLQFGSLTHLVNKG